jgi:hypothetical protein
LPSPVRGRDFSPSPHPSPLKGEGEKGWGLLREREIMVGVSTGGKRGTCMNKIGKTDETDQNRRKFLTISITMVIPKV